MRAADTDVIHLSEEHLLRRLTSRGIRTNVLVTCRELRLNRVVGYLLEQLASPVTVGVVSADLKMPDITTGIWVLHDIAALTGEQQAELAEWLSNQGAGVRVVSISSEPLWPMVAAGRFLEPLYYQLNTIVCEATPGRIRIGQDEGSTGGRAAG